MKTQVFYYLENAGDGSTTVWFFDDLDILRRTVAVRSYKSEYGLTSEDFGYLDVLGWDVRVVSDHLNLEHPREEFESVSAEHLRLVDQILAPYVKENNG